jgi:cytidyltransferase-like protein
MNDTKVFVSGCFDLLHAGHVEFFRSAAEFGDLYVSIGSDETIEKLKDVKPTFNQEERLFIISHLKPVKKAFIASGHGIIDFENEIRDIRPDFFIVNRDGHTKDKENICKSLGIEYKILERIPGEGLPERSSTEMRAKNSKIPYRIDIAGGWLDQPCVSKFFSGPVLTISIEPDRFFNFRSGFATSTRNKAIKLWGEKLPEDSPIHLAKILFSYDNPPGTTEVAGAQDSIGIAVPNLNCSYFAGSFWPEKIETIDDPEILTWLEDKFYLIPLKPREHEYDVYDGTNINAENAKRLSDAALNCFRAILDKDFDSFAKAFTESFEAQTSLFPATFPEWINPIIEKYKAKGARGWKLSGAGGGGYLVLLSEKPIEEGIKIKIRRK